MQDFRNLQVWRKGHALTLAVYRATETYPKSEVFGLVSQMRRSSSSIPTNIAEGCGRNSDKEFARFLEIGMGSASELEYQLLLSFDLKYLTENDYQRLNHQITEIKKMLAAFIRSVRNRKA